MTKTIYDAHTHIFPDKIAEKASKSIGGFYGDYPMFSPAAKDALVNAEKDAGITNYLVCSSAVVPHQTVTINDFISSVCKEDNSFFGLGTIHPDFENIGDEIERIKKLGLHGIKLHPEFQHFNIDDEKAIEVYKECIKNDIAVLFHMGDERHEDKNYDFSSPARLAKVIEKLPELRVHAAHFGGYTDWERAWKYLPVHKNLYFDTSSSLFAISKETAYKFFDKHGVEKFMFGSDFPMWSPKGELERLISLGLDEKSLDMVLCGNFREFYRT